MDAGTLTIRSTEAGELTFGGSSRPIVSAMLDMTYGAIPTVTCVAAADTGNGKGSTHVHGINLSGVSGSIGNALSSLSQGASGSFSLKFSDDKSLSVDGWCVTGAGISRIAAAGGEFGVQVTLAHPAVKVGFGGGYFMGLKGGLGHIKAAKSAKNPLESGTLVFDALSKASMFKFFKNASDGGGEVGKAMLNHLSAAAKAMSEHFDGSGIPCMPLENKMSGYSDALKTAVAQFWASPGRAGGSVMESMTGVFGSMDLSIVPDYKSEKLPVMPRFAWGESGGTIKENEISAIEFPGMDPSPICGVAMPAVGGGEQILLVSTLEVSSKQGLGKGTANSTAFMPYGDDASVTGKFVQVSPPTWLENAALIAAGFSNQKCSTVGVEKPTTPSAAQIDKARKILESLVSAKAAYMKQVFSTHFRSMVQAAITMPFMEQDIVPGKRIDVELGGSTAFSGFVYRTVHMVDTAAGSVGTTVFLSHCAPPGGYPEISWNKPPMYS